MFDELKEVEFKEITDFKSLIMLNTLKNKTFAQSLKSRGIFKTLENNYDETFCEYT